MFYVSVIPHLVTFVFTDHQGIIEDVYLLGAPVSGNPKDWEKFETVVAGHITNAFSR